jgi:multisubunit Na+/H+ antiporter MnhF subunit
MVFASGVAPILADAATYAGIVALGHVVMRMIAGPASEDRLVRRSRKAA